MLASVSGCGRLHEAPKPETVYVFAEQTYLRDRVAAVSNRVALVTNGEPLEVVEHGRRFVRVKTRKGEVGWIEDHLVIDQATYDQFALLKQQHQHDPVVATGVLRDALYLHLKPGRATDRFYLLPENDKLQLLVRASVPRPLPGAGFLPPPSSRSGKKPAERVRSSSGEDHARNQAKDLPAVPMEDWWLVRDDGGHVGWLLARRLDVDVPDEIGGYSEGQKMVGAYVLTKVEDPESTFPDKQVPIYLAVLNAYKEGLPYDFDQIRVFTWNLKKHRYETAYRQRNLEGYLPVEVTQEKVDGPNLIPVFTIRVAAGDAVATDPLTGAVHPVQSETMRFALEGQLVRKLSPSSQQAAGSPARPSQPAARAVRRHRRSRTSRVRPSAQ
ncbi:MAG TPA: SH3 domain-containing protein [Acidobacteriaceae bacterium]|nr:SH3 domain-containing protein [Acidobacteriaceae bacterium]